MKSKKGISRRRFIRDASAAAIGGPLLLGIPDTIFPRTPGEEKTKVVLIRNKDVLDEKGNSKYKLILEMIDDAVISLTGKKNPLDAWKTLVKKDDIVGIKTNSWRHLPTPESLEQALKQRIMDVGVSENNIGIRDRGVLKNPIFKKATALINTRPMRTHHWSGVGSLLKNYIMFDSSPSSYHPDSCADLAKLWKLPHIKGKTRLNILVMLTPQFHGVGPHSFNPRYVWKYYGLLVGFDPVAVDSIGVRIIQAKRRDYFEEEKPLNPPAKHIFLADTRHHLGTADPNKIDLIKIGYNKDCLI